MTDRIPDEFEYRLGLRVWNYNLSDLTLHSLFNHGGGGAYNQGWPVAGLTASCPNGQGGYDFSPAKTKAERHGPNEEFDLVPPVSNCACGIYCAHDATRLADYVEQARIFGLVKAWGKIIPGTDGFRAQHAKIAAFFDTGTDFSLDRSFLEPFANRYGVPIIEPDGDHVDSYRWILNHKEEYGCPG